MLDIWLKYRIHATPSGTLKIGFGIIVVNNVNNQNGDKLDAILREYSELPEYSETAVPAVNTKSLFGDYPINIAATRGLISEISTLLDHGADVNAMGEHGYTPLHDAVEQGHIDAVKFLVEHGASVAIKNNDGDSPTELAKLLKESEIHRFLNSLTASS
ncbi:MAG: ankyrin repeat domain-containing protein [Gammaproteobacteria bacterium]|nr:ankyrin repeat domain-containing protein [Gammaproteobacteria bacterium]